MRLINILFVFLICVFFYSFNLYNGKSFRINGAATGFEEGTKLYLAIDMHDGSFATIAYTNIKKERFIFEGTLNDEITRAVIGNKDFVDFKSFWLENTNFSFRAEKGKLNNAIVEGTETQQEANELDSSINLGQEKKEQLISFIRAHPNSIISAHLLSHYGLTWGWDTTSMLYDGLSTKIKATIYGKKAQEFLTIDKNLKIGDKYYDFSQNDAEGRKINLSDFKGKVVLVEFWGSWCGPCRKANPELVRTYYEYKSKGFEILGVGVESDKTSWLKAIKDDKLPWTNVTDLKGYENRAAIIYGVSAYPTNFLIDRSGIIVARDIHADSLREKLNTILQ
jgi:thiol-disulfide isomerase/thioredoxin